MLKSNHYPIHDISIGEHLSQALPRPENQSRPKNSEHKSTRPRFYSILLVVFILFAAVFIIARMAEIEQMGRLLASISANFLVLALVAEGLWMVVASLIYQKNFKIVGVNEGFKHTFFLSSSANFANVVTPSWGMAGLAVFWADAEHRGYSKGSATVVCTLYMIFEYLSLLLVILLGFFSLLKRSLLGWPFVSSALVLFAFVIFMVYMLFLGLRYPDKFRSFFVGASRFLNRLVRTLIKREFLPLSSAETFTDTAIDSINLLQSQWRKLMVPFGLAMINKMILITILMLMFTAFKEPFTPGILIAGFSLCYLFFYASPTPAGIGIVEGVMTLALKSLGVPLASATLITLSFRGFTFWLPLLVGFTSFRFLSREEGKEVFRIQPKDEITPQVAESLIKEEK
jgi:uncharacterized protein (TIRG00374 family)